MTEGLITDRTTYYLYYTRDGETWYRDFVEYGSEERLRKDWKVLLDRGDAKVIERTTTEKYID